MSRENNSARAGGSRPGAGSLAGASRPHPAWLLSLVFLSSIALSAGLLNLILNRRAATVIDSGTARIVVRLLDGSKVEVSPGSRVEIVESGQNGVRARLMFGRARFEVGRMLGRDFKLAAGTINIGANGSNFRIRMTNAKNAAVEVEEGIVEIHEGQGTTRLSKGDQWPRTLSEASLTRPPER